MGDIKMPISDARREFNRLPERFLKSDTTIEVTRQGESIMAIMPWHTYDAIRETLEIMTDPELMEKLRESIRQAEAGELIPWEEAQKEL